MDLRKLLGLSKEQFRNEFGSPTYARTNEWSYSTENGLVTLVFEEITTDGSAND